MVAVRADDHVSGADKTEFGQQSVFNAAIATFVIMGDAHFLRKLAADEHLIRGIDVFLRSEVVHHQKDPILVENPVCAHGPKRLDGERPGNVVGKDAGKLAIDDLSGFADLFIRVSLKNFLSKRMRHEKGSGKGWRLQTVPVLISGPGQKNQSHVGMRRLPSCAL